MATDIVACGATEIEAALREFPRESVENLNYGHDTVLVACTVLELYKDEDCSIAGERRVYALATDTPGLLRILMVLTAVFGSDEEIEEAFSDETSEEDESES